MQSPDVANATMKATGEPRRRHLARWKKVTRPNSISSTSRRLVDHSKWM